MSEPDYEDYYKQRKWTLQINKSMAWSEPIEMNNHTARSEPEKMKLIAKNGVYRNIGYGLAYQSKCTKFVRSLGEKHGGKKQWHGSS